MLDFLLIKYRISITLNLIKNLECIFSMKNELTFEPCE